MKRPIMSLIPEKILLLDGGMGSQIFGYKPTVDDYGGPQFDGCVELLNERRPEWIKTIHTNYFKAGSDAVETNTFGCNTIVLGEFGIAHRAQELNEIAVKLAREAAGSFSTPKYVVGSVGPGTKLVTLGHVTHAALYESYLPQMRGLIVGGVDAILIETAQDLGQIKAAVRAARTIMRELKVTRPIWVQVTIETNGAMLLGSDVLTALHTIEALGVDVIGMNCASGPDEMAPHIAQLCAHAPVPVSCLPNAGLPENINGQTHYRLSPEDFAHKVLSLARTHGINILGGCCGTTPAHIAALAPHLAGCRPRQPNPSQERFVTSLYSAVSLEQQPRPTFVGERTNANGSKLFRDKLGANNFDAMVAIAKTQAQEGAHVLDVSVAYVSRNETADMVEFLSRVVTQVNIPIMIDSTEVNVMEAALQVAPGKCIVNSINFEDGDAKARAILELCRTYGAAVVALTIDERGMAKTADEKLAVAHRLYDLAVRDFGLHPGDLVIDPLTFTLASGDATYVDSAKETLNAIERIKRELPGVRTILGLSNVSFGLKPRARQILNSMMLYHAVERGLDLAILNASKIVPMGRVTSTDRALFDALLFNDRTDHVDPLKTILERYSETTTSDTSATEAAASRNTLPLAEQVELDIIDGNKTAITAKVLAMLETTPALEIINTTLLGAMKIVGERFGSGEMQLPFVLASAETMKTAVQALEPHLPKSSSFAKGKIILATVKGDVHDIGKNLVDIILSNNGYEVINLGIKQSADQILHAFAEHDVDAIGMSGLLVKSTAIMKENLEQFAERGITVPVILGGAALTRSFVETDCQKVYRGPVYYAEDAFTGLNVMNQICGSAPTTTPEAGAPTTTPESDIRVVRRSSTGTPLNQLGQSSWVEPSRVTPQTPFLGTRICHDSLDEIFGYLDDFALVRNRWGFTQGNLPDQEFEALLNSKAWPMLAELRRKITTEQIFEPAAIYGYFPACSGGDGNDILIYDPATDAKVAPADRNVIARFRLPRQSQGRRLCIADFLRHESSGELDVLGLQVVTMGKPASEEALKAFDDAKYRDYFLIHGLSTELTEAYAELIHKRMRAELGMASGDAPTLREIFSQGYQGSRYSFGYPACPDLEDNATVLHLLEADRIGVTLSDSFQMIPEQTTSAIVIHHPQARYFAV
jgi:5-methyltetrahydrofolate--homocysteine methyltransferase